MVGSHPRRVHIVTGDRGSGKTTFLQTVVNLLASAGIPCCGLLAIGSWKDGQRSRYDLVDLGTGSSMLYCQRKPVNGWEKIRHFYINPSGRQFGEEAFSPERVDASRVFIFDEIGPFELQGKGWAGQFENALRLDGKVILLSIRTSLVQEVARRWDIGEFERYVAGKDDPAVCADHIRSVAG